MSFPPLINTHQIDDITKHHLMPPMPARSPLFYGLPKVHKPNIPLRPIVAACESPTDQLSNYVTRLIQTLVEILSFYFQDSKHFLQLLESLPPLPENAILVTADVTSLYNNIPHEERIESVLNYMKLHAKTLPPQALSPQTTGVLLETILMNNNLARKYHLEISTHNIYKALLHSSDTLLYRTPKVSSSRTVLPVVTPS